MKSLEWLRGLKLGVNSVTPDILVGGCHVAAGNSWTCVEIGTWCGVERRGGGAPESGSSDDGNHAWKTPHGGGVSLRNIAGCLDPRGLKIDPYACV